MAINAGVNISKFLGYAVLAPLPGVNVSKFVGYSVLAPLPGVDVAKFNAYAVLGSPNVTPPIWGDWSFSDGVLLVNYDQSWDMPTSAEVVSYSILSGSLPGGLSLSALTGNQAHVSGLPIAAGTFPFSLRAVNTYGTQDKSFSIAITGIPHVFPVAEVLKGGVTGTAYSETISGQGGTAPYTFAVTAGALPDSLSLAGATGIISGTPTVAGTFNFTIEVTDADAQTGSQAFEITITTPGGGGGAGSGVIFA